MEGAENKNTDKRFSLRPGASAGEKSSELQLVRSESDTGVGNGFVGLGPRLRFFLGNNFTLSTDDDLCQGNI